MRMLNRFCQPAALFGGALLLCFSLAAHADEVQDINKLFKQGQHEQALERVNTYLAGKPKDAQARFLKGLILTEQGKTNDAIRIFSELTEDYPELPEPYNNLAVLYAGQGQYDKARVALEMAIRTHPSYATAHENLGDIYAKMASQAYDRALQLDRSNTGTQTKLALIKDLFTGGAAKGVKATHAAGTATSEAKPQLAAAAIPAEAPATPAAASAVTPAKGAAPLPAPVAPEGRAAGGVSPAQAEAGGGLPASAAPIKEARSNISAAGGPAAAKKPAASNNSEVLKVVHEWAAAWSSKNLKRYFAFYAKDFRTPGGESRKDWEAQRRERISKPQSIHVSISDPRVKLIDDSHASVSFRQSYRASHLKTSSSKTLVLVKSGGNWLIQEERSGK
ncbi:MAG: tetratricopeptide repeat protein [Betaproteobacteria bacterium]|nr:tetratricopeptide repeat protein [Betaproteobacteria bacterium]